MYFKIATDKHEIKIYHYVWKLVPKKQKKKEVKQIVAEC